MSTLKRIRPAFITFTGIDRVEIIPDLIELSRRYPIEWGILIDPDQEDLPLFPKLQERLTMQAAGLRLSAHICGKAAAEIVTGLRPNKLQLDGFSRLQINHSRDGSSETQIFNAHRFAVSMGTRAALQTQDDFPTEPRADWLYDVSFGLGQRPTSFPPLGPNSVFCGYSGGISPETAAETMAKLPLNEADDRNFWIDMENGVRTNGLLDVSKCEAVCRIVYGEG